MQVVCTLISSFMFYASKRNTIAMDNSTQISSFIVKNKLKKGIVVGGGGGDRGGFTAYLLLMICWRVWAARNDKVWNGKSANPESIVESTKCYLADWKSIVGGVDDKPNSRNKPDQRWEKPLPVYLKLNTDASVDPQSNKTGYGWVLRNDAG
nr:uncharacterized protein LOC109191080 [Ipomoea batatas]GME07842.1 uncharacterized protein LOC109191080 [Ipomoea batatas]